MSASFEGFLDTNVLLYAFSDEDPRKKVVAQELIRRGIREHCYALSTQVLLEFYVNAIRRTSPPLEPVNAGRILRLLANWPIEEMTTDGVLVAAALSRKAKISLWDAAILTAARRIGCTLVLSEDLNAGQVYDGVIVRNPFEDP